MAMNLTNIMCVMMICDINKETWAKPVKLDVDELNRPMPIHYNTLVAEYNGILKPKVRYEYEGNVMKGFCFCVEGDEVTACKLLYDTMINEYRNKIFNKINFYRRLQNERANL